MEGPRALRSFHICQVIKAKREYPSTILMLACFCSHEYDVKRVLILSKVSIHQRLTRGSILWGLINLNKQSKATENRRMAYVPLCSCAGPAGIIAGGGCGCGNTVTGVSGGVPFIAGTAGASEIIRSIGSLW